jgi:hypothetical protein
VRCEQQTNCWEDVKPGSMPKRPGVHDSCHVKHLWSTDLPGRKRMFWLTNAYTVMSSWMRRPCSGMAMYTVWLELQQAWLSRESSAIGVLIGASFRRVLPLDRLSLRWECAQMTLPDCPKVERVVGGAKCRNDNVCTCMKQRAALSNSRDNWFTVH